MQQSCSAWQGSLKTYRAARRCFTLIWHNYPRYNQLGSATGFVPQSFLGSYCIIKPLLSLVVHKKSLGLETVFSRSRSRNRLQFYSANQICGFLHTYSLFKVFQSGFRMYHNIDSALVKILNDFLIASDKGPITVLFLLDLSAAFDTVNHQILS